MKAFDAGAFQAARQGRFGADLRFHQALASTQDEARAAVDAAEGCVVLAERQEAGRGRWGKRWEGAPGQSLLFTVVLEVHPSQAATLPLLLGLASAEALRGLGAAGAGVKWPNDLWAGDRKLGGLLLETHGSRVLAGCGLNVLQAEQDLPDELKAMATSLRLEGLEMGREAVLAALLGAWEKALHEWKIAGFEPFLGRFGAVDVLFGRACTVRSAGQRLEGLAQGVDPDGALRLALPGGELRRLQSAEIEQVRPAAPD